MVSFLQKLWFLFVLLCLVALGVRSGCLFEIAYFFLAVNDFSLSGWTTVYSATDGFQVWAIMNKIATNICVQVFV